jgi:hypothetical protein
MLIPGQHGTDSKNVNKRGGFVSPGWGHFFLETAEEEPDHVKLTFVCLAHTDKDCAEKKYTEWLFSVASDPSKAAKIYEKVLWYAKQLGLCTDEQIDKKEDLDLKWAAAAGKQVVLHLEEQTHDGKTRTKIAWKGIFSDFNDPEVMSSGCPFDEQTLKTAGIKLEPRKAANRAEKTAPASKGGSMSTTAQKPPATPSQPAGGTTKDYGDL